MVLAYGTEIADEAAFDDHDLVVAADGINSRFRERYVAHFEPETDLRPNRFSWMGSTRPLDAFTFLFEETEWGPFIAHAYQYEPGARPGSSRPTPRPSRGPGSTGCLRRKARA